MQFLKLIPIFILFLAMVGCQVKESDGTGGGLVTGHTPVANKFTLTTNTSTTYLIGQTISFNLSFPRPVTVTGNPYLMVVIGSTTRTASYVSGSGSATLLFQYTTVSGDNDADGISVTPTVQLNPGDSLKYNTTYDCGTGITVPSLSSVLVNTATGSAPVTTNISPAAFNEDTQSTITLAYTDAENDQASSCAITSPTNVTVTTPCACAAGVCTVGVTGVTNYSGSASFSYTVTAGTISNASTATLTINPVADAPVAININPASFPENTQRVVTLSYTDAENDLAASCAITSPTNVTVTQACACAAGICTVGVTGTLNYNGPASFNYTVTANSQVSNSALASLSITSVDSAPVANDITPAAFNEDTQSTITLSYTDAESDLATSCSLSSLTNVTVTSACTCAAGVCTVGVTGTSNYNGAASFNYTVTANANISNSALATLTINPVADAPVASNITPAAFNEDTAQNITLSYTDPEGDLATTCSVSGLSNITVSTPCACAAGVCTVGVTGSTDYNGSAGFTYTVTAGVVSNSANANLTISPVDDAPVANNITPAAFPENTASTITLAYTDIEGDASTSCSVSSLTNVTVSTACACAAGVCTVGVTGVTNYDGPASFNFTVTSNGLTSNSALASLTINNTNSAPVASNISPAAFNEDTLETITLSYTDADSDLATTCSTSNLSNVTVTTPCACAAGVCTLGITGTLNYSGAASFDYTVTANGQLSNTATASLTINTIDDAPVAANITPSAFNEDSSSSITLSYTDTESDQATSCSLSSLNKVTVTTPCSCTSGVCTVGVTGALNDNGAASFAYTVTANSQVSNSATANFTIIAVDDAPVADNITPPSFNEDAASTITLSYTDVDLDQATSCSISGLSNVTVSTACSCAAGVCTVGVTGLANYSGSASFNYTVTSTTLTSNSATATLTITAQNDAPVAANISPAAFNEDTASTITLSYTDTEGDQASTCTISSPTNVTVTTPCACAAGVCTVGVTGTSNYNGSASFAYTVTAVGQSSNSATATLTINPVADAPVAVNITPAAFNEDTQSIITLTYTDAEGDFASSCSTSGLTNVTVTQACSCTLGTCTVGVTGTSNYNGVASFSYTVTANSQTSNTATASLTISAVDDAPVAANITPAAFNEDTQSIITLSYTDNDSQATSCTISSPTNVTVTQACSCAAGLCTVGVTGTLNYNGAASFSYTVNSGVVSNVATSNFTINAVNDNPVISAITAKTTNRNTATAPIAFTITDVDNTLGCNGTRLSMTSSDTSKVLNTAVAWSGTAPNCTAVVTPVTNAVGTTTLTFNVNDGAGGTAAQAFVLTITFVQLEWTNAGGTIITSYDFGTPGANTSVNVFVKNTGTTTSGAITITPSGSNRISTVTTSCAALAPNATCALTIDFNNAGPGGLRTTTFTAADPSVSGVLTVTGTK